MVHTRSVKEHLYLNYTTLLKFIVREKWPISKHRQLEFGLEFERKGFDELQIFSEGSSKPFRDNQVIRVPGGGLFFELNI